jgi:hypothetical protein
MKNFILGLQACSYELTLVAKDLFGNTTFWAFTGGIILSVLIMAFVLTKNPKQVPLILRYSQTDSFMQLAQNQSGQMSDGTYQIPYTAFVKMYHQVKTLFLMGFVSVCVMIITLAAS